MFRKKYEHRYLPMTPDLLLPKHDGIPKHQLWKMSSNFHTSPKSTSKIIEISSLFKAPGSLQAWQCLLSSNQLTSASLRDNQRGVLGDSLLSNSLRVCSCYMGHCSSLLTYLRACDKIKFLEFLKFHIREGIQASYTPSRYHSSLLSVYRQSYFRNWFHFWRCVR